MSRHKGKTATPKPRRPQIELEQALRTRFKFLQKSAAAYDGGDHDEALRLSIDLRALLHYGQQRPLLYELGLLKRLQYVDSSSRLDQPPGIIVDSGGGLTILQIEVGADGIASRGVTVPRCYGPQPESLRTKSYGPWWKSDLVVTSETGDLHSRMFVVTEMANTEAAHTDAYLDGDYRALQPRPSTWALVRSDGTRGEIPSEVARASVRQVAWEMVKTLETECSNLL